MSVLLTGGTGYIGSHTLFELISASGDAAVLDNLSGSKEESLRRVAALTGKTPRFYKADLCDIDAVREVFHKENVTSVIHFAGLKAVGESVAKPLEYYHNNITGTLNLLRVMREKGVKNIVFSSSATVYGVPETVPITERFPLSATNPYGQTKLFIEQILKDVYASDPSWNVVILRYFNPVGAHPSGRIGEDPKGIPNNLMPIITQVAVGKLKQLNVYGNDYPTPDGTGVRDYIHIMDLAAGHVRALEKIKENPGLKIYNLGTGNGYSVLEFIRAFEKASGQKIPFHIAPRRPGDVAECYADCALALSELGWKAERGLEDMCRDAWRWQSQNPDGYGEGQS